MVDQPSFVRSYVKSTLNFPGGPRTCLLGICIYIQRMKSSRQVGLSNQDPSTQSLTVSAFGPTWLYCLPYILSPAMQINTRLRFVGLMAVSSLECLGSPDYEEQLHKTMYHSVEMTFVDATPMTTAVLTLQLPLMSP